MKDLNVNSIVPKLKDYLTKSLAFISKHRVVLTVIIACSAIFASVVQAQGYLNPTRNETLYTEQKSGSTTKTIDIDVVNKLSQTKLDKNISVDSNFVENRNNPFNE